MNSLTRTTTRVLFFLCALLLVSCSHHGVTNPALSDREIYDTCHIGSYGAMDPRCMYDHMDAMPDASRHGFVARHQHLGVTRIIHIDAETGAVREIVSHASTNTKAVWVTGHAAIAFDEGDQTGAPLATISSIATNGRVQFELIYWINTPPVQMMEPMFGDNLMFAALFRWTSPPQDTITVRIEADRRKPITLGGLGNPFNCRMSRDGRWIVCQTSKAQGIFRIDRNNGSIQKIITGDVYEPALSSDGKMITWGEVYHLQGGTASPQINLGSVAEDGTVVRLQTWSYRSHQGFFSPVFSPDDKSVAYVVTLGGGVADEIQIESVDGARHTYLGSVPEGTRRLDWQ